MMRWLRCESCEADFRKAGPGRPPRYCPDCRSKYGYAHQKLRRETIAEAPGSPCVRCGLIIEPGQPVDLDHDSTGTEYLGYSHASCNRREGAVRGNAARYSAYYAVTGKTLRQHRVRRPQGLDSSRWTDEQLAEKPPIPEELMGPERPGFLVWSATGCWTCVSRAY
jgi:hypothetical protein